MTDGILLKAKIAESGYKLRYVAKQLGITYQALLNKTNGKSEFKASEIQTLCRLLNIGTVQKDQIFFCAESRHDANITAMPEQSKVSGFVH